MKEFTRILKFTLCSVSAAMIEMAVFALLNEFTGLPYWPCYLVALVLSVLWNFTRRWLPTMPCLPPSPQGWEITWLPRCCGTSIW